MVKSFAAFAIFAVLGASVIALPGFAPKVEASEILCSRESRSAPGSIRNKRLLETGLAGYLAFLSEEPRIRDENS